MQDRFTRQRRLPEVGDEGQARLAAAHFRVLPSPDAWSELTYLERAGAGCVTLDAASVPEPEPFAHAAVFRHEAARRHAAGAWRALGRIRTLISRAP